MYMYIQIVHVHIYKLIMVYSCMTVHRTVWVLNAFLSINCCIPKPFATWNNKVTVQSILKLFIPLGCSPNRTSDGTFRSDLSHAQNPRNASSHNDICKHRTLGMLQATMISASTEP